MGQGCCSQESIADAIEERSALSGAKPKSSAPAAGAATESLLRAAVVSCDTRRCSGVSCGRSRWLRDGLRSLSRLAVREPLRRAVLEPLTTPKPPLSRSRARAVRDPLRAVRRLLVVRRPRAVPDPLLAVSLACA